MRLDPAGIGTGKGGLKAALGSPTLVGVKNWELADSLHIIT